ncbi:MAG: hypothetical protein LBR40_01555 [Bacilli bacterium]|nr:hypothetical protein [Bacilli bacterium]
MDIVKYDAKELCKEIKLACSDYGIKLRPLCKELGISQYSYNIIVNSSNQITVKNTSKLGKAIIELCNYLDIRYWMYEEY